MRLVLSRRNWWQEIDQKPQSEIPHLLGLKLKGIVSALIEQTIPCGITEWETRLLKEVVREGILITPDDHEPDPRFPEKIELCPEGYEFIVFIPTSKDYRQFVMLVPIGTDLEVLAKTYAGCTPSRLKDIS